MNTSNKTAVGAAAASAAIAAAFLTTHHGLMWGVIGGAGVGGIVGLLLAMIGKRSG